MKRLELKIPPVAVFLLSGGVMWLLSSLASQWSLTIPAGSQLAGLIAAAGLGIAIAGVLAFRAERTTVDPRYPEKASSVVRSGIYRHSRNPMYLGLLLLLLAWSIFLANLLCLIVLPAFVLYVNHFQIRSEERALEDLFGDDYRSYMNDVRRWL